MEHCGAEHNRVFSVKPNHNHRQPYTTSVYNPEMPSKTPSTILRRTRSRPKLVSQSMEHCGAEHNRVFSVKPNHNHRQPYTTSVYNPEMPSKTPSTILRRTRSRPKLVSQSTKTFTVLKTSRTMKSDMTVNTSIWSTPSSVGTVGIA